MATVKIIRAWSGPRGQRGAVLYVALIMLILLALLGIAGMQVAGMQEKMASNYRAVNVSSRIPKVPSAAPKLPLRPSSIAPHCLRAACSPSPR